MFHREDITEKALRLLTLQDLETVGITKFVHRVLIHNYLQEGKKTILYYYEAASTSVV